jgi:hypothetical protein
VRRGRDRRRRERVAGSGMAVGLAAKACMAASWSGVAVKVLPVPPVTDWPKLLARVTKSVKSVMPELLKSPPDQPALAAPKLLARETKSEKSTVPLSLESPRKPLWSVMKPAKVVVSRA